MNWFNYFLSPFRRPKLKFYVGKIAIGTPYFLPRKIVTCPHTKQKIFAPKKFGFDFVKLGWKTKWSDTDYRYEWAPLISFVFLKWQIVLTIIESDEFWEAWLYYHRNTDKTKSREFRVRQMQSEFSLTRTVYQTDKDPQVIDYYSEILQPKYYITLESERHRKLSQLLKK